MSGIDDYKITDTAGYKVQDTPGDSLVGTVEENKQVFDKLGELIITHFNNAMDYLKTKKIDNSYTAKTGKPTTNLTPDFGDTVTISQVTTDNSGRVTDLTDRTVTIPDTLATTSSAGLLSAADKIKLDGVSGNTLTIETTFLCDTYYDSKDLLAGDYGLESWSDWVVVGLEDKTPLQSDYSGQRIVMYNGTPYLNIQAEKTSSSKLRITVYQNMNITRTHTCRIVLMQVPSEV